MSRIRAASATLLLLFALTPGTGNAASTGFRMTSLAFRDPHFFVSFIGCRDITDNPLAGFSVNGRIQTDMTSDTNPADSLLDLSELIVFKPLDQNAATGTLQFVTGQCTTPSAGVQCQPAPSGVTTFTYQNQASGACLAPLAGTTSSYTPSITSPTDNCFVTDVGTLTLGLAGLPMTLHSARIGGVYSGVPATGIVNGLIMGFLVKTDADATILPASMPLIGGQTLSSLLPGGSGNCASHSDVDNLSGEAGWWMYLNFVATAVPYSDGTTGVEPTRVFASFAVPRPNPFRGSVELDYTLPVAGAVRVWVTDIAGRRIADLRGGILSPGAHSATWDGRDAAGARAPAGVYFIHAEAAGRTITSRVALVR
jgi:FlgD Ig-like domain